MLAAGMPVNDQTPAPARRFLPPSSSSSSKPWTSSSSRRPPFAFSQSNFTPSSASPLTRSSRFETPAKVEKEDIDTSFEEGNSSPSRVPTHFLAPFALSGKDAISDEDDNSAQPFEAEQKPRRSLPQVSSYIEDETDFPQRGKTGGVPTGEKRDRLDPITPSSKRRKVAAPVQKSNEIIHISSSPEPVPQITDESAGEEDLEKDRTYAQHNDHRYSLSPELVTPPMPTRFKTPATKGDTIKPFQPKPSFRPFTRDTHLSAEAGLTLPDAFSPSRKKGKKDYNSGGLADTVRNWILHAATEELQRNRRAEKSIAVNTASMDRSGRAIEITDEDGEKWLLVGEQSRGDVGGSPATLAQVLERRKIHVRGTSTNWKLSLSDLSPERGVFVAAQWDVG